MIHCHVVRMRTLMACQTCPRRFSLVSRRQTTSTGSLLRPWCLLPVLASLLAVRTHITASCGRLLSGKTHWGTFACAAVSLITANMVVLVPRRLCCCIIFPALTNSACSAPGNPLIINTCLGAASADFAMPPLRRPLTRCPSVAQWRSCCFASSPSRATGLHLVVLQIRCSICIMPPKFLLAPSLGASGCRPWSLSLKPSCLLTAATTSSREAPALRLQFLCRLMQSVTRISASCLLVLGFCNACTLGRMRAVQTPRPLCRYKTPSVKSSPAATT